MITRNFVLAALGAALFMSVAPLPAAAAHGAVGAVYTMTNAAAGNEVLAYDRFADGSLAFAGAWATGGDGSGDGLGNQGGVILSDNGRWLLVVNAASDDVSVFRVRHDGIELSDVAPSGGVRPVSVAIHGNLVYVVNAGGGEGDEDSIAALRLSPKGDLMLMPGSVRPLSAPSTGPAQVGFSPDGRFVLVTEKGTSIIDAFPLNKAGMAGPAVENPSSGMTPFAFGFGRRDQVFVSEVFGGAEDAGAVSSYLLEGDGSLTVIDGSVPNTETAPCWLVTTRSGRRVYTTNTPDDSLSAYAVSFDGHLELIDGDGRTGEPGAGTRPLDMDLSDDGRFLYTLNIGDGTISTFGVAPDGSLPHLHVLGGVPAGVNGLAAR